ncbi:hypothetical protein [Jeotgalibacillus aurantiacus]|uniref:hypothetical protein n=1 Tax=Jeotgalibacillus aurantiacus TaxID=2763266 RepID=UPI001D0A374E|nr:hypothetical protein [Jeotgalibacillus aurantiacus]
MAKVLGVFVLVLIISALVLFPLTSSASVDSEYILSLSVIIVVQNALIIALLLGKK